MNAEADPFRIDEAPLRVQGWSAQNAGDPMAALLEDVAALMREAAEQRTSRAEQESQHGGETRRLLLALVEALDAFERVRRSVEAKAELVTPQMKLWLGNYRTIGRLLEKALGEHGVGRIEKLERFDPQWHKAGETVVDPSREEGLILEKLLDGYVWNGQVLRKAEVKVAVRRAPDAGALE
ncbi:MAG: nucleotide exchange factor GrpE [Planctomycetota bacterium]|nr:nucleotide exchange factor GrpE [Planctomycetota bacterium]